MAIDMTKTLVSVGAGVVDEVLEWNDRTSGRTGSFTTATDLGRLGLAAVGYIVQIWSPRYARFGEALALSETPLLVKSIAKPVMAAAGVSGAAGYVFTPRMRTAGFAQTVKPEFQNVGID